LFPALVAEKPRRHEVADILRDHAHALHLSGAKARAVRDIVACRSERLGGHLEVCKNCGFSRGSYNSCRNRHCPKCQILKQELWAEAQQALLLPTAYFQIVFTIPRQLHPFFRRALALCLALLFEAVSTGPSGEPTPSSCSAPGTSAVAGSSSGRPAPPDQTHIYDAHPHPAHA
jgi:hypothetical protein